MDWPQRAVLWFLLAANVTLVVMVVALMSYGYTNVVMGVLVCVLFAASAAHLRRALLVRQAPGQYSRRYARHLNKAATTFAAGLVLGLVSLLIG